MTEMQGARTERQGAMHQQGQDGGQAGRQGDEVAAGQSQGWTGAAGEEGKHSWGWQARLHAGERVRSGTRRRC